MIKGKGFYKSHALEQSHFLTETSFISSRAAGFSYTIYFITPHNASFSHHYQQVTTIGYCLITGVLRLNVFSGYQKTA